MEQKSWEEIKSEFAFVPVVANTRKKQRYGYNTEFNNQELAVEYLLSKGFIKGSQRYENLWVNPKTKDDAYIHKIKANPPFSRACFHVCYYSPLRERDGAK